MGFFSLKGLNKNDWIGLGVKAGGFLLGALDSFNDAEKRRHFEAIESNVDNKFHLISEFSNRLTCNDEDE